MPVRYSGAVLAAVAVQSVQCLGRPFNLVKNNNKREPKITEPLGLIIMQLKCKILAARSVTPAWCVRFDRHPPVIGQRT